MEENKQKSLLDLYNSVVDSSISKPNIIKKISSSNHFQKILIILGYKFFQENKRFITTTEILNEMHLARSYIHELLSFLVRAKLLQKIDSPSGGGTTKKYILIDEALLKECIDFIKKFKDEKNNNQNGQ